MADHPTELTPGCQTADCAVDSPRVHLGETIKEDVLEPLGMGVNQLAKALAIDAARMNEIVRGRRGITADTALCLARYLGTSAEFWIGLQSLYDLRMAEREKLARIKREVKPKARVA